MRYRVEAKEVGSSAWESIHYTDSLPVAKRYAERMKKLATIHATRVMDQRTEMVVATFPK
ncbi:MAG: hypothetical protein GY832_25635 [Chloroflexi bacterium]|nr:hypothetical protein [Chloroflexota bacterium]